MTTLTWWDVATAAAAGAVLVALCAQFRVEAKQIGWRLRRLNLELERESRAPADRAWELHRHECVRLLAVLEAQRMERRVVELVERLTADHSMRVAPKVVR